MNIQSIEAIIEKYSPTHLICDSSYPLIANSTLLEEAMIYNLSKESITLLCAEFQSLTGKSIDTSSDISILSGGQKVILMALLAMQSPAEKVVLLNLDAALDKERVNALHLLIEKHKHNKVEVLMVQHK